MFKRVLCYLLGHRFSKWGVRHDNYRIYFICKRCGKEY